MNFKKLEQKVKEIEKRLDEIAPKTWDDYEDRLVENTKQGDYEIDTCFCNDTNKYETGISKLKNNWIIVEEYNTKGEASIGHKKWVEFTKAEPKKAYSIQLEEWEEF